MQGKILRRKEFPRDRAPEVGVRIDIFLCERKLPKARERTTIK